MAFNYQVGALFMYGNIGYYKYLGYDPNRMNPYRFMVVTCSKRIINYINEHSEQWTEDAVGNGILIPLSIKINDKIKNDIVNRKKSMLNLKKISNIFNLPDDIKILIAKNMGYIITINSHIIQNVY